MSSLSDLELFERHSFRWGDVSEDDAPMRRVAEDALHVVVSKWVARRPGPFEPRVIPQVSEPFLLDQLPVSSLEIHASDDASLTLRLKLAALLPNPWTIHRAKPLAPAQISFDEALQRFASTSRNVVANRVREYATYWFFPVLQIGSCGTIVSKLDGTTIVAGSAFPVDDWLWGYERGLLDDGPLDLLITEVMDIEASKNLLLNELKLRSSSEILRQLETPPVLIASVANWTAIRWLRLVTDRVFRWEIRGQNRTTA